MNCYTRYFKVETEEVISYINSALHRSKRIYEDSRRDRSFN